MATRIGKSLEILIKEFLEAGRHNNFDNAGGVTKKVRAEVPDFEGTYPTKFSDWLVAIEEYFDWCDMYDERRDRFARMKLVGLAKIKWIGVEKHIERLGQPPISSWQEMKAKLQEKYMPSNYYDKSSDIQSNALTLQGIMERYKEKSSVHANVEKTVNVYKMTAAHILAETKFEGGDVKPNTCEKEKEKPPQQQPLSGIATDLLKGVIKSHVTAEDSMMIEVEGPTIKDNEEDLDKTEIDKSAVPRKELEAYGEEIGGVLKPSTYEKGEKQSPEHMLQKEVQILSKSDMGSDGIDGIAGDITMDKKLGIPATKDVDDRRDVPAAASDGKDYLENFETLVAGGTKTQKFINGVGSCQTVTAITNILPLQFHLLPHKIASAESTPIEVYQCGKDLYKERIVLKPGNMANLPNFFSGNNLNSFIKRRFHTSNSPESSSFKRRRMMKNRSEIIAKFYHRHRKKILGSQH